MSTEGKTLVEVFTENPGSIHVCGYCRFYRQADVASIWGTCRYNPPTITHGFPDTHQNWWCGRFDGNAAWLEKMEGRA